MYYYCEEFGYYVNAPDCGLCEFRHDCESYTDPDDPDEMNDTDDLFLEP